MKKKILTALLLVAGLESLVEAKGHGHGGHHGHHSGRGRGGRGRHGSWNRRGRWGRRGFGWRRWGWAGFWGGLGLTAPLWWRSPYWWNYDDSRLSDSHRRLKREIEDLQQQIYDLKNNHGYYQEKINELKMKLDETKNLERI